MRAAWRFAISRLRACLVGEVAREIGQLALDAGFKVEEPEILVLDVAAQEYEGRLIAEENEAARSEGGEIGDRIFSQTVGD